MEPHCVTAVAPFNALRAESPEAAPRSNSKASLAKRGCAFIHGLTPVVFCEGG